MKLRGNREASLICHYVCLAASKVNLRMEKDPSSRAYLLKVPI